MNHDVLRAVVQKAKDLGFDVSKLLRRTELCK